MIGTGFISEEKDFNESTIKHIKKENHVNQLYSQQKELRPEELVTIFGGAKIKQNSVSIEK